MSWDLTDAQKHDKGSFLDRVLSEAQKLKRHVLTRIVPQEHPGPVRVGPAKGPKMIRITGKPKKPVITQVSGPPLEAKKPEKPKAPSERMVALASDRSLHGRVFTETKKESLGSRFVQAVERTGSKVEKHLDFFRPDHPLYPVTKWAEKRAGTSKERDEKSEKPRGEWGAKKLGGGSDSSPQSAENVRRQVQFDTAMARKTGLQNAANVSITKRAGRLQPAQQAKPGQR